MGTLTPDQLEGLTSMNLHDLFRITILSRGTLWINEIQYIKYTGDYIPRLQIHQQNSYKSYKNRFPCLYIKWVSKSTLKFQFQESKKKCILSTLV